jgi:hypothetical protein
VFAGRQKDFARKSSLGDWHVTMNWKNEYGH